MEELEIGMTYVTENKEGEAIDIFTPTGINSKNHSTEYIIKGADYDEKESKWYQYQGFLTRGSIKCDREATNEEITIRDNAESR